MTDSINVFGRSVEGLRNSWLERLETGAEDGDLACEVSEGSIKTLPGPFAILI